MAQLLHVVFRVDEIQKLLELSPDKIVIRTSLEGGVLAGGESVGYLNVEADAMRDGSDEPLGTVGGCPIPPCEP
jgi:hypothetical protein